MPGAHHLSLSDVLKLIGWTETKDRSAMNRYLAIPDVDQLLGAVGSGRHTKYPDTHVWLFKELSEAHERGTVAPKTAIVFLRERIEAGPPIVADYFVHEGERSSNGTAAPTEYSDNRTSEQPDNRSVALAPFTAQVERIGGVFADTIIQRIKESGILPEAVPVEDRLIGRDEAAQILGLTDRPQLVSRRVPAVLPGQWSRVQILRYIESLRMAAEQKAALKKERKRK